VGVELLAETNSVERADALPARLEDACRGLLTHARREQSDPLAPRLVKPTAAASFPDELPGGAALVRAFKDRHYREWADEAIPALQRIAAACDRVIELVDGRIRSDRRRDGAS
jgi:hypothetical protein